MIEINLYRLRIGTYTHKQRRNRKCLEKFGYPDHLSTRAREKLKSWLFIFVQIVLISAFIPYFGEKLSFSSQQQNCVASKTMCQLVGAMGGQIVKKEDTPQLLPSLIFQKVTKKQTCNKKAKSMHGNKQAVKMGIKNMHLNIRSLGNKVFEIKNIVKEHRPHILGLSECELKKGGGLFDESKLKIPISQLC